METANIELGQISKEEDENFDVMVVDEGAIINSMKWKFLVFLDW